MAITNKEILEEIEFLKTKLPNGEFALLKKSVEDLHGGQETLRSSIRELKKQLLGLLLKLVNCLKREKMIFRKKEKLYFKLAMVRVGYHT